MQRRIQTGRNLDVGFMLPVLQCTSFFGLGLEDGPVATFWLLLHMDLRAEGFQLGRWSFMTFRFRL